MSSQHWSGNAQVQVSIVNWIKGKQKGPKTLRRQLGKRTDSPWEMFTLDHIGAALSGRFDVTKAAELQTNVESDTCDQGQTPGHKSFVLAADVAKAMVAESPSNTQVLYPCLGGDDFLSSLPPRPQRYVIDFHPRDVLQAQQFALPFRIVKDKVLPTREAKARGGKT